MPVSVVVGGQFGDEGKGKIVDLLSEQADFVARFNGGNNAGHTVVVGETTHKFHLLPTGVLRGKHCCLGPGVVVDPRVLLQEIRQLSGKDFSLSIDGRCHVILPHHQLFDAAIEGASATKIGTTGRGIGPCYAEKAERSGLRFADLLDERRLREKLEKILPLKKRILSNALDSQHELDGPKIAAEYSSIGAQLARHVADVSLLLHKALRDGKRVVFEGAQGTFLDNSFGTYPFVTSSHTIAANAFVGTGLSPRTPDRAIGVAKAYATRVGGGPFPTEIAGETAERIIASGKEFGTTTGRKRRVGWLDLPMLRTASRLNGFTEIALTKIDVLSWLDGIPVCTAYEAPGGELLTEFPATIEQLAECKPQYAQLAGFEIVGNEKNYEELQQNARGYLKFVEKQVGVPIKIISIGAERTQTIFRQPSGI